MCKACDELFRRRKAERLKAEEKRVVDDLLKALNAKKLDDNDNTIELAMKAFDDAVNQQVKSKP